MEQILITCQKDLLVIMIDGKIADLSDKERIIREKLSEIKELLQ